MPYVVDLLNQFPDARQAKKVLHPLSTILFIAICAIFCGADSWEDIVLWGETKTEWLSRHVDMSRGMPSWSTFRRIFMLVSPAQWGRLIRNVTTSVKSNILQEDHIPIDGKALRGSRCKAKDKLPIQMVSAWSVENEFILAEVKTSSKSNEITAIPLLLELLDLEGATISIDAIGCQAKILNMIVEQGGHYVVGLKQNQPKLYETATQYAEKEGVQLENLVHDEFDDSHGRDIRRRYFAFKLPDELKPKWLPGSQTIIATETIYSDKYTDGKVTSAWRYHISSHNADNTKLPDYIRGHWAIENKLHWVLDVHLGDDQNKKHEGNAAENFAKTKRFLFNLVKAHPSEGKKRSMRAKFKLAGWDLNYLVMILFSQGV